MASDQSFVDFIADQISSSKTITSKKMFGEYAIYSDNKVVALICENKLFVKPTSGGRIFIGEPVEAPSYPNAKPCFFIEDKFEDRDWISNLISITADELPEPKPKPKKKKKTKTLCC